MKIENDTFEQFKIGDPKAFQLIIKDLRDILFAHAYKIVDDTGVAEDAVVHSFLQLWDRHHTFIHMGNVVNYLKTVCTNKCINELRSKRRKITVTLAESFDIEYEIFDYTTREDQLNRLWEQVDKLSFEKKELYYLRFKYGKSVEETSKLMNMSLDKIYDLTRYVNKKLRKELRTEL